MDGLSGAASGIAVASLALQLGGSIKQLYDFWDSVKEAPDDVRTVTTDLSLLSSVLAEMAFEEQKNGPDQTLNKVLEACCDRIQKLTRITSDMEPGFASRSLRTRKWTAFKAVLKGEKIQRFQMILEGLKSTLILAQQSHHSRLNRMRYETQQQNLTTITNHLSGLNLEQFSATITTVANTLSTVNDHTSALRTEESRICRNIQNPVQRIGFELGSDIAVQDLASNLSKGRTESCALSHRDETTRRSRQQTSTKGIVSIGGSFTQTLLGAITTTTKTRLLRSRFVDDDALEYEDVQYEQESSLRILPAQWLLKLGFNYAYNFSTHDSSTQGWQWCIKPINLVPDDAPIFKFCRQGEIEKVRDLISRNLASARDVNSNGYTALHYAVKSHSPQLCKLLIEAGADKNARSFASWEHVSPLQMIKTRSVTKDGLDNAIDTCRIFEACFEFWDEVGDGWDILASMGYFDTVTEAEATLAFRIWFTKSSSPDIKANYHRNGMLTLLLLADDVFLDVVELVLKLSPSGALQVHEPMDPSDLSLIHRHVVHENWNIINLLLDYGADPHQVCLHDFRSPVAESPLSIAMYSSWVFLGFRNTLRRKGLDLEDFARQELKPGCPLLDAGWRLETLTALLELEIEPDVGPSKDIFSRYWDCDSCGGNKFHFRIQVQPSWQDIIESVKNGTAPQRIHGNNQDKPPSSSQSNPTTSDEESPTDTAGGSESSHDRAVIGYAAAQPDEESSTSEDHVLGATFGIHEVWCVYCWHHFKETGHRGGPPPISETQSSNRDDSSEDDFSPFLFNT